MGGCAKFFREIFGHIQRMIATRRKGLRKVGKQPSAVVVNGRRPPVNWAAPDDLAPKSLGNGLMAEANAQDRPFSGPFADELHRCTSVGRPARPRRNHDRAVRFGLSDRNTVTAHDVNTRPELLQRLGKVPDERIFVVEQQDQIGPRKLYRYVTR